MRLVNGSISHILSPPKGCAHCGGEFREEESHLVGYKGHDGQVYCSPEHAALAYKAQLAETELGSLQ